MKRRLFSEIMAVVMLVCVISFSGCGVKEYKSQHDSGTYVVNSFADFDRLAFKDRCSPSEIAKVIPDFCIYEYGSEYSAYAKLDLKNMINSSSEGSAAFTGINLDEIDYFCIYFDFNADKEFTEFRICFSLSGDYDVEKNRQITSAFLFMLALHYGHKTDEYDNMYFPFGNGSLRSSDYVLVGYDPKIYG